MKMYNKNTECMHRRLKLNLSVQGSVSPDEGLETIFLFADHKLPR